MSESGRYREGLRMKYDLMPAVVMERDGDPWAARFYMGSGITEPNGRRIAVSRHVDEYPSDPSFQKLSIPEGDLDDLIELLQELRRRMDRHQNTEVDGGDRDV